ALQRERHRQRRQHRHDAGLDPANQRVRHTRLLKALAAYLAPAIVSAAGNAHCAATPATESVRAASVSTGTVESGSSTIQRSCVVSSCASTRSASSGSLRKPRRKPVAAIICTPFHDAVPF